MTMTTPPSHSSSARRKNRYAQSTKASEKRKDSLNITGKALALVFLAIIAAFLFYGYQYLKSRETINASITYVSHEVIDDSTLRVWADVTRNHPDEPAYCILQAFDYDKSEVGRREIALAPDGNSAIRVSVDIPTNARAVAGGVYGCSSLIPDYLDTQHPSYTAE